jgi:hypothetical protein
MQINDAIKGIISILQFNPLLERTQVISQVEGVTCWLNA